MLVLVYLLFLFGIVEGDIVIFYIKLGILKVSKVFGYLEYKEDFDEEEEELVVEKRKLFDMGVVKLDFFCVLVIVCDDMSFFLQVLGVVEVKWVGMSSVGDYLV